jgi:hypothetical protein
MNTTKDEQQNKQKTIINQNQPHTTKINKSKTQN